MYLTEPELADEVGSYEASLDPDRGLLTGSESPSDPSSIIGGVGGVYPRSILSSAVRSSSGVAPKKTS